MWDLDVKKAGPKAKIVRSYSGIVIGGKTKDPGSYNVKKGVKIGYIARVENVGGTIGTIRVVLVDTKNEQSIDMEKDTLYPGSWFRMDDSFTFDKDRDLKFKAQHKANGNWVTDDTYGD